MMKTFAASLPLLFVFSAVAQAPAPIDYRFDEVKRKVTLTTPTQALTAAKGQKAQSGDKVSTGFFSYALIASDHYKAKFEVFGSTDVHLAGGTPGVILSLDRGRLHAIFDKLTGTEPRIVQTPGALLAVRGTEYTVNVDRAGATTLDVWEGTVEIRSELRHEPMLVHAGQESSFGRHEQPTPPREMPPERRRDGTNDHNPEGQHPDARGGHEGGPQQPGMGPGGHGPGGTQPMPQPPPNKPPL
jgi:hypothetical protein